MILRTPIGVRILTLVALVAACGDAVKTQAPAPAPAPGPSSGAGDTDAGPPPADVSDAGAPREEALAELDAYVTAERKRGHLPGMSVAVARGGRVVLQRAWGDARLDPKQGVDIATRFQIASVSKTITSTAVMVLVDQGKLALDRDVNELLPFRIENPAHASAPITVRMLLTHTSSVTGDDAAVDALFGENVDASITLRDFVAAVLVKGGAHYAADKAYGAWAPGTKWSYSNFGMALLGLIVEEVAKEPFAAFTERTIFAPLGMTSARWRLADVDLGLLARPHQWDLGQYFEVPLLGIPDWPAGSLMMTAGDLARFLAATAGGGALDGARVLSAASVAEMLKVQHPAIDPTQGLGWYHGTRDGADLAMHGGSLPGVACEASIDTGKNVAVVVLTNGDWTPGVAEKEQAVVHVASKLHALAPRF